MSMQWLRSTWWRGLVLALALLPACLVWTAQPAEDLVGLQATSMDVFRECPKNVDLRTLSNRDNLAERLAGVIAGLQELEQRFGPDYCAAEWKGDLSEVPQALLAADPNSPTTLAGLRQLQLTGRALGASVVARAMSVQMQLIATRTTRGMLTDNLQDLEFVSALGHLTGDLAVLAPCVKQCRQRLVALSDQGLAVRPTPGAYISDDLLPSTSRDGQVYVGLTSLHLPSSAVKWMAEPKMAICGIDGSIVVRAGSASAKVDGASVKLSAPPRIEDGRLMISVRDVKPLFGLDYKWDPKLWAVRIFAPES